MQAEVVKTILPTLEKMADSKQCEWIEGARIRMTMVPSMGFFIVVPLVSCPRMLSLICDPDLEEILDKRAAEIGWNYCFAQT